MTSIAAALAALLGSWQAPSGEGKARIYILAGQSNMEGKAKVKLMVYQASQPAAMDFFRHLRKDGKWIERDDVWIKFLDRKGKLTVGYGSPSCIGPELGFATAVGDRYAEPVLLIKTAWGGKDLYRDFRPPSSGLPPVEALEKMLAGQKKKNPNASLEDLKRTFGKFYRAMIDEVNAALADLKTCLPPYRGQGYEIAGFVWFQGWNDMINDAYTAEYTGHMINFIRDVRKDLKAPDLPFVIGQMGVDGAEANPKIQRFKAAQAAAAEAPGFKGNVELVKTDLFWDTEAHAVFKKGWRENLEEWNKVGSDFPYHYLGSAKTMILIGRAFGEAMIRMADARK